LEILNSSFISSRQSTKHTHYGILVVSFNIYVRFCFKEKKT
jgi:hypothetical protein